MNIIITILLCAPLHDAILNLYQVENGRIQTDRYGVSEVCDFAKSSGSDDLRLMCSDYVNAGCVE